MIEFTRRVLLSLALLLTVLATKAHAQLLDRQRIACIGDSITEGNANPDHLTNAWPLVLQRLLETAAPGRYESKNFGCSGATALRKGSKPYWDQGARAASLEFAPELVIINLGANDAVDRNWLEHGADFEEDYRELILSYQQLNTKPRIWLSNLTPVFDWHPRTEERLRNTPAVEEIIQRLAVEFELPVIDFKSRLAQEPKLFPDGLHPNTAGNELMAQAAVEALTGEPAPTDPSLRWKPVFGEAHPLVEAGRQEDVLIGRWSETETSVQGTGAKSLLLANVTLAEGDFHLRARLRMLGQKNSAAGFVLGPNFFGFEGKRGTVFRNGPQMLGLRLLHPAPMLWERDAWIEFEVIRNGETVWFVVDDFTVEMATIPGAIDRLGFDPTRSSMQVSEWSVVGKLQSRRAPWLERRTLGVPWIDLSVREELVSPGPVREWGGEGPPFLLSPDGSQQLQWRAAGAAPAAIQIRGVSDESWSNSIELPASLSGAGYQAIYLADGRLLVTFLDKHPQSPTRGDWVAWVGTYADLVSQREGEFTCRLWDLAGEDYHYVDSKLSLSSDGEVVSSARLVLGASSYALERTFRFHPTQLTELLPTRGYDIPTVDLDRDEGRHVLVDRESGQYLGHVTTELLEDGKTLLAVYPKGHGRGPIVYKRSLDGGQTWSERLPTPENWASSREVPTIHQVMDPQTGKRRLILWSGLYPARLAHSEDDGRSWSPLEVAGDWGGIVVMGFVERLADGRYLAMFHDDGRFIAANNQAQDPPKFTLYQTISADGGLSWSEPSSVWEGTDIHLCEPGCIRSPDGKVLAVLLRENSRTRNSFVIFSKDEGASWSAPRELPASLTGDRHTLAYAKDGRLFACFRDTAHESPTKGDWVGWIGTWADLYYGRPGQYRIRFKDNKNSWDSTYPGVEVLPDGTFVVTTYGHWVEGEAPYILSARFQPEELDARAALVPRKTVLFERGMNGVHTYRIPALVTTNAGTLLAACDARLNDSQDLPNRIDTALRRSTDGGRTWGEIQTIAEWSGKAGAADPCLVVDRETGRIWCAITWADGVGWRESKPGFGSDSFHLLLIHSDDDGLTWSDPMDITESVKDPSWRSAWFSPGSGLQLQSGRLLLPFSVADGEGAMLSYATVSDDHGASWRSVGPIGERTNECMLAQLHDGTLVCNLRSMQGKNQRAVSLSKDDGESWSPIVHDPALVEPVCQGSLLTIPKQRTPNGREWLVFCNPASTKREALTIRVSLDGGQTWPIARIIHKGPAAYSSLTLLADGGIGLLYECGEQSPYEQIRYVQLPLAWLLDGAEGD